jgi:poly(glycerol-phosphate) alpha-glucosyltransferase
MNEVDLNEMGHRGRELVKQRFTWQTVATQMKEVYDWILGGGDIPSSVIK